MAADEVRARLADWHRTGDIGRLWPGVTTAERLSARREIRRVVSAILAGEAPGPLVTGPGQTARALGIAGFSSGLGPLLGRWIEDGRLGADGEAADVLATHLAHGRGRARRLGEAFDSAVRALRDGGVEPVVLKGMHTRVLFPEPGTRPSADIDLFVPRAEREAAVAALGGHGMVETERTLHPERSVWRPAGPIPQILSLEVDHEESPWTLDLHHTLDRRYFRGTSAGLGESPPTERLQAPDGSVATILPQPHLAAFLALHASEDLAKARMLRFVELILVTRPGPAGGGVEWGELDELLEARGLRRFTWPALALCDRLLPGSVPEEILVAGRSASSERAARVVEAVDRADLGPLPQRSLDNKLMWASGGAEFARALSEVVWPSDDGTGMGPVGRLARGVRTVFRSGG